LAAATTAAAALAAAWCVARAGGCNEKVCGKHQVQDHSASSEETQQAQWAHALLMNAWKILHTNRNVPMAFHVIDIRRSLS
jgi:hypothetical protein